VQKAKDACIFGLVFGTLGVAQYLTAVDSLQRLIKHSGRRSYTFCMGKLNPAKLANFSEIEMYVLVACPETSLVLFDSYAFILLIS
jgi:diphthamide biosynthesis protein 2